MVRDLLRSNQRGVWFKNRKITKEASIACIGAGAGLVSHYDINNLCMTSARPP